MKNKYFVWVVVCMTALSTAYAQGTNLDEYVRKIARHPQVVQFIEQSQQYRALAEGELGLPDPRVVLGIDNISIEDPSFNEFLPTAKVLGFQQSIPSASWRRAKSAKHLNVSQQQKLQAAYRLKKLTSVFIRQLSELDKVNTLEVLARQKIQLYRAMDEELRRQLESGRSIYGRFSEVDIERTDIEQQLNNLTSERVRIEQVLIQLVGEVPSITPPKVSLLEWNHDTQRLYPLVIASENIAAAGHDVAAAKAAFKPTYDIQLLYKQRESGRGFEGDDWLSLQASMSLPLWSKKNQTPKLKAARSKMLSAESAYDNIQRIWVKRMVSMHAQREALSQNIQLLKNNQLALQNMINAAKRDYESGNTALETVLDAQIDALTLSSTRTSQQSRYVILSAEINSHIVGGPYGGL